MCLETKIEQLTEVITLLTEKLGYAEAPKKKATRGNKKKETEVVETEVVETEVVETEVVETEVVETEAVETEAVKTMSMEDFAMELRDAVSDLAVALGDAKSAKDLYFKLTGGRKKEELGPSEYATVIEGLKKATKEAL